MHKLWGSAIQATHSINISLKGQSSTISRKSAFLTIYGSTAGKNGVKKTVLISLASTTNKNTESLNLSIIGPSKDRISEVMPLSITGNYSRSSSNPIYMSLYSVPDDIEDTCYVTEGPDGNQTEIILQGSPQTNILRVGGPYSTFLKEDGTTELLVENDWYGISQTNIYPENDSKILEEDNSTEILTELVPTGCFKSFNRASKFVEMTIKNDGGSSIQSHLNLTLKFNPTNIVTMTLKAVGTPQINIVNITMKPSHSITSFVYLSMPKVHALKTAPVKLSTRGF